MSKKLASMTESEFNAFMVEQMVANGRGRFVTPSKNAHITLKGECRKVSFGNIPDAPTKNPGVSGIIKPAPSPKEGGAKTGSYGTGKSSKDDMWTEPGEFDKSVYIVAGQDTKKRITIRFNVDNEHWQNVLQNIDDAYCALLDDFVKEIINFARSIAIQLQKIPPQVDQDDDSIDLTHHKTAICYVVDHAFQAWYSASAQGSIGKMLDKLEKLRIAKS
jgi:hypothetical protein